MRKLALMAMAVSLTAIVSTTASAATVGPGGSAMGILYEFTTVGGNAALATSSATFNIHISGINAATDLEGGRSGVNDFAFSTPGLPAIASGLSAFGAFTDGGLNSTGCNGSGGFFCFNGALPPNAPALAANSTLDIQFTLNLVSGNFLGWTPAFKIDWVGSQNNYDLVSQDLVGSGGDCVLCTPTSVNPVPIPGAVWLFASGMAGLGVLMRRRKAQKQVAQATLVAA